MEIYQINSKQAIEVSENSIKVIPAAGVEKSTALGVIAIKPNFNLRLGIPYEALEGMMRTAVTGVIVQSISTHKNAELFRLKDIRKSMNLGTFLVYKGKIIRYFIQHDEKDTLGFSLRKIKLPNSPYKACELARRVVSNYAKTDDVYVSFKPASIMVRVKDDIMFSNKPDIVYIFKIQSDGKYLFESMGYNIYDFSCVEGDERWVK